VTFPDDEAMQALEVVAKKLDEEDHFYQLRCNDCEWGSKVWTMGEATIRRNKHEESTGHEAVSHQKTMVADQNLYELGIKE
jgi:hypothetical protein